MKLLYQTKKKGDIQVIYIYGHLFIFFGFLFVYNTVVKLTKKLLLDHSNNVIKRLWCVDIYDLYLYLAATTHNNGYTTTSI